MLYSDFVRVSRLTAPRFHDNRQKYSKKDFS